MSAPLTFPFPDAPGEGEALQVAENTLWMRLPLPMALDHVNVFAFEDPEEEGGGWTLIDTGFDTRKTRRIWEKLLAGPLGGKPVKRVIVTHHHPDHVGLAGWFQRDMGAELVTTRTAWLFSRMLLLDEQMVPVDETIAYWQAAGMDPEVLEKRRSERPFNYADIVADMPLGFKRIKEGSTLRFGGRDWRVHIGNGHAPEHATLWSTDGALVIGGDQLLATISPNLGVYATEPEADPVGDWLEACERLSGYATDTQLVLPGHKLPFTGLPTRMRQLIQNHHHALDRLEAFLETPQVAGACFPPLFKRKIGAGEYGLALVEAVGHLNHLLHQGRVTRIKRDDGAWLWQRRD
ncbi:Glyoxylase, beta-lactamase superfamily II [Aliiroseovarius crassostreae]|uniref:MBL fold metallo-hydrolase n=1 Tax=Aliiroseovarius crassostreae TaxID=154981 RepID=A0A0P7KNV6_9RHOB|nr:MBL fold metallo-hydrolase [Aliiroseovarius crassostreae]KPN63953.1 MBL fold metallo-hydrolase [Aliiroseovarius crassostreae]SFU50265.1 Glyoxylase, beta-lactamase superfamily II [Aliiroseovarius crassostreae]